MSVENLSTGIEASATGKSLNSGDVAVHPAARHKALEFTYRAIVEVLVLGLLVVVYGIPYSSCM